MEMVAYDGPEPRDLNAKLAEATTEMPAETIEEVKPKNGHLLDSAVPWLAF